ncbi:hypothetical protein STEG23_016224 [Scotinomys teguina]
MPHFGKCEQQDSATFKMLHHTKGEQKKNAQWFVSPQKGEQQAEPTMTSEGGDHTQELLTAWRIPDQSFLRILAFSSEVEPPPSFQPGEYDLHFKMVKEAEVAKRSANSTPLPRQGTGSILQSTAVGEQLAQVPHLLQVARGHLCLTHATTQQKRWIRTVLPLSHTQGQLNKPPGKQGQHYCAAQERHSIIFKTMELLNNEVKPLAQGHRVHKKQVYDLNPESLAPGP